MIANQDIHKYKTIRWGASDPDGFDRLINDALRLGWRLYGNPYVVPGKPYDHYLCQSMVFRQDWSKE